MDPRPRVLPPPERNETLTPNPQRRILAPSALAVGAASGIAAALLADGSPERADFTTVAPLVLVGILTIVWTVRAMVSRDRDADETVVFSPSGARLLILAPLCLLLIQPLFLSPYDPTLTALLIHLGIALVALVALLGPKTAPNWLGRAFELALATLLLFIVGGELSLRLLASQRPSVLFVQQDEDGVARLQKLRRPGMVRFGTKTNDDGAFDAPFDASAAGDRKIVLLLGDEAMLAAVPRSVSPSVRAEQSLGDTVIWDQSLDGFSPVEADGLLAEWEADERLGQVDSVVVAISGGDDWSQCIRRDDAFEGLALWLDSHNAMLPIWVRMVTSPERKRLVIPGELGTNGAEPTAQEIDERFPALSAPESFPPPLTEEQFHQRLRDQARQTLGALDRDGLSNMLRILERCEARCRRLGIGFGVLVLPHRIEIDRGLAEATDIDPAVWSDARSALVENLRKRGTKVVDAAEFLALQALSATTPRPEFFHPIDTRLNRLGAERLGDLLASLCRRVAR